MQGSYKFIQGILFSCLAVILLAATSTHAAVIEITTPTTIFASDTTYDNNDLIVNGTTLTIDGSHSFNSLQLINTSTLTHSTEASSKLTLNVKSISIDSSSSINLNSRGLKPTTNVTGYSGGSYGGAGGLQDGTTNGVFGDYTSPLDFGVGGSGHGEKFTRGGGAIKIIANTLQLDGNLTANGMSAPSNWTGGGSGGAIWLDVDTLSGSGSISANGGNFISYIGGGGGGGRIAIDYSDISGYDIGKISNHGGIGYSNNSGTPGTIYLKSKGSSTSDLIIDNTGGNREHAALTINNVSSGKLTVKGDTLINISGSYSETIFDVARTTILKGSSFTSLTATGASSLTVAGDVQIGQLSLKDTTVLTTPTANLVTDDKTVLTVETFTVAATASINLNSRGLKPTTNVTGYSGGSYGGAGGLQDGTTNGVFGDYTSPLDFGVGGSGHGEKFTRGGGAIKIIANTLQLDGNLTANGMSAPSNWTGGGSGGAIWLDVDTLSGSGSISANGGNFISYIGGGGGGGRIAVYYGDASGFDLTGKITSDGGTGYNAVNGSVGTIHLVNKDVPTYIKSSSPTGKIVQDINEIKLSFAVEINPNTFTVDDVNLIGPSGDLAMTSITKVNNIDYIINLAAPISVNGEYTLKVGPNILTPLGRGMDQDRDGFENENPDDIYNSTFMLGKTYEVTTPQTILSGDKTYDNHHIIVDGTTLTIDGSHSFTSVQVINGGVITHTTQAADKLSISANTISIDSTSKIDVTGKGNLPSLSSYYTGGSYGGNGGLWRNRTTSNPIYGSEIQPIDFGVGAKGNSVDTRGGGAFKLIADQLILNGKIISNGYAHDLNYTGGPINSTYTGGASGGSIWVDVNTLSGIGNISTNGAAANYAGGGGGGRVAIYYSDANGFDLTKVLSRGGSSQNQGAGGAGTVYLKNKSENLGELKIDNSGVSGKNGISSTQFNKPIIEAALSIINANGEVITNQIKGLITLTNANITTGGQIEQTPVLYSSTLNLNSDTTLPGIKGTGSVNATALLNGINGDLVIDGAITLTTSKPINVSNLSLLNGVTLTHPAAANATSQKLEITANTIHIDATSKVDVSGRGFYTASGVMSNAGGSYGGYGGRRNYYGLGTTNEPYGNAREPVDFGIGQNSAHRGGGALKLITNNLTLDGSIISNGTLTGSGGSVWLDVGGITGSGSITANGIYGPGTSYGGTPAGSGGRIAVYYSNASGFDLTKVYAKGGGSQGAEAGGAGTVYFKNKFESIGQFKIDNSGIGGARGIRPSFLTDVTIAEAITVTNAPANIIADQISGLLTLTGSTVTTGGQVDQAPILSSSTLNLNSDTTLPGIKGTGSVNATALLNGINGDLVIDGAITLTTSKPINVSNLSLLNGVTLTHPAAANATSQKLEITANTIHIDATSKVDVSGRGFYTASGVMSNAGGSYGGYGGRRNYYGLGTTNEPYGNAREPVDFGIGQNSAHRGGGALKLITNNLTLDGSIISNGTLTGSGGSVWLDVGGITGSGSITANGIYGPGTSYGGTPAGSGGRIAVYYSNASGFDLTKVYAKGGGSQGAEAGGAGTVYFKNKFESIGQFKIDNSGIGGARGIRPSFLTDVTIAEAITVTNAPANIIADQISGLLTLTGSTVTTGGQVDQAPILSSSTLNLNSDTTLPGIKGTGSVNATALLNGINGDLVIDGDILFTAYKPLTSTSLSLLNGVTLTHPVASNADSPKLEINVEILSIDQTSKIDVTGKGIYVDGTIINGAGGSYGGYGGFRGLYYSPNRKTNTPFGNARAPIDFGVGPGSQSRGGGSVKVIASSITLDGSIITNGEETGSGGSVWLDAGVISGTGGISANAIYRPGTYYGGSPGGSGGRIALYYADASGFDLTKVYAKGGGSQGAEAGGAGTVYFKNKFETIGQFKIDNSGISGRSGVKSTPISEVTIPDLVRLVNAKVTITGSIKNELTLNGAQVSMLDGSSLSVVKGTGGSITAQGVLTAVNNNLLIDGSVRLSLTQPLTVTSLSLLNGATLTHPVASNTSSPKLSIIAESVFVDKTSKIDVSYKGLLATSDVSHTSGGSYGGSGGVSSTSKTTNPVYGDEFLPIDFGTGGKGNKQSHGGGALKLIATQLNLNGQIISHGETTSSYTGGGSGGSIWLDVGVLSGTGYIATNGGNGSSGYSGGGGGGRTAIYYSDASNFDLVGRVESKGGNGYSSYNGSGSAGAAGTIHLKNRNDPVFVIQTTPTDISATDINKLTVRFSAEINPTTFTTADIVLTGPAGVIDIASITKVDAINYTLRLTAPLTESGDYTLKIGPNIETVLGKGMDQDKDTLINEVPDDVYTSSFTIDKNPPTVPVVTSHPSAPEVTISTSTSVTLTGTREVGSSIWIDGVKRLVAGTADWTIDLTLAQGQQDLVIHAEDSAGNKSETVAVSFNVDSIAPTVSLAADTPIYNDEINTAPVIALKINETGTGIDLTNSTLSVTRNGQGVVGKWAETNGVLTFTPSIVYIEGQFIVTAQIKDKAGLSSASFSTRFVYDKTPPAAPVVNSIPAVSNINTVIISGTKEANTAIISNAQPAYANNALTTWSFNKTLVEGDNTFILNAKDKAGNISSDVTVTVRYDNTAPAEVTATAVTETSGTAIKVDWLGYDEFANGNDIDHYSIFVETAPFTSITGLTAKINVAAKTFDGVVNGLTRNTNYYVAVVAFDSTQNSTPTVSPTTVTTKDTVAPEDVNNITMSVTGDAARVNWEASANTADDLASYHFYFNGETTATVIPASTLSKQLLGLLPATSYSFKITAVDNDGNESAGVTGTAVTILENPTGLAVTPYSGKVELSWNPVADPTLVKQYAVYSSTSNFTNVDLMTPTLLVDKNTTTRQLAGLTNDTAYYFAVTAINTSGGESTNVTTVTGTPLPDSVGPELSNIQFNNTALIDNLSITQSGNITLSANDQSGMSRVDFLIDGILLKTDANGSSNYSANWDITSVADGAHTITVKAIDTLENSTRQEIPVTVALSAPSAPSITVPANNFSTNKTSISVSGTAEKQTQVQLYNNNVAVGSLINVASNNSFTTSVTINEGTNSLTATAKNRGGEGSQSPPLVVTLDSSIPNAPVGLSATAKASGQIQLSWNASQEQNITVDVYRSTQPFTTVAAASKVNTSPLTGNNFTDLPPSDGLYYYRAIALNQVATSSELSAEVSASADNTAPHAVSIKYTPSGNYDEVTKRMAPGNVAVVLTVNEALLTTPFLSIAPNNGTPISVNLTRVNDTEYKGNFTIKDITPTGTAFAVFSARDAVGNRGTVINQGETIEIDAQGPIVSALKIAPNEPIKNDSANPVSINFEITLSEVAAEIPTLSYRLSGTTGVDTAIDTLTQVDQSKWVGSFTLPGTAGLTEVENLSFVYSAIDDLGNSSTKIEGDNAFQVYQGDLPPLSVPGNLKATPTLAGKINLTWNSVEGAAEYVLYRQTPDETALSEFKRVPAIAATEQTTSDQTSLDGSYRYSVASVRKENGQEGISTQSNIVTVSADSSIPAAPQALALELVGSGIKATWQAATGTTEALTYSLYRSSTAITAITGLTPIKTGITELTTLDTSPSDTEHNYAIVAVDAAGNTSPPSDSVYLNFDLLPVATLEVSQTNEEAPQVSWTHNGSTIAGYDIYLESIIPLKLNGSTLLTNTNYTDTGYSGDARTYTVKAIDSNGVESIGRTVSLPKLSATLKTSSSVKRGIMNQLEFEVSNYGKVAVNNISLNIKVNAIAHNSSRFSLAAGETKTIPVIVGGYSNLPDLSVLETNINISPSSGEKIRITRTTDIVVGDGSLVLNVATETFTRGGTGKVQFSLENTSNVETEVILASANGGNASNELRFKLLDVDNNVLATQSVQQDVGTNVIRLANGTTVARIAAGGTFTSNWFDLAVPNNAPQDVSVEFEIDKLHYHVGRADHVAINGLKNKRKTTLVDTSYIGQLSSVSPQLSYGDQNIVIKGQAIERSTSTVMPSVPLKLVIAANGFERSYDVYTDSAGLFTHTFKPLSGESGNYKVSVIHPDVLDRPQNGTFTINRVVVRPTTLNVNTSRNYDQTLSVNASTGPGSQATNLRLVYNAADQLGGVFPQGVQLTPEKGKNLGENQSASLGLTLRADDTAVETGSIKLNVMSDESGAIPLAVVTLNYTFSAAVPVLNFTPNYVETGASQGTSINETITLSNAGLDAMNGINVSLLNTDNTPAPNWVYLTVPKQQGSLAIGEKRPINFVVAPNDTVVDGNYSFKLRITSINHPQRDVNIFVAVTQSGQGNVLFKVEDIYTLTKDSSGNIIQGLQGAKLYLQNERVLSEEFTQTTDANGETIFNNLPAGWYKYRASADKHQEVIGRVQIKAGVTASEPVFLDYNLVTVEWSVTEIALQDRYSIVLNSTFETDVPAAVVVSEPSSIELPKMAAGEVFQGEFTLTNYGLIRADNITISLPQNDQFIRYEIMGGIPTSLEAKQKIVVPFRAVQLKSFDPSVADGTGGGCSNYAAAIGSGYDYVCANNTIATGSTSTTMTHSYGSSCGAGTSGGGSSGGGSSSITFVGGSGTVNNYTPTYNSVSGSQCIPQSPYCPLCEVKGMVKAFFD